jgi:histone acetyltransferase
VVLCDGFVMGGISYRIFSAEEFIEIAFCAVNTTRQAQGFGAQLMRYLKFVIQSMCLYDILTCADNDAVEFFKKQGFNDKAIMMDPKRWVRRIKDYESVTLVHCHIEPQINYMKFTIDLDAIDKFIQKHIGNRYHERLFVDGDVWKPFPQAPTFLNLSLKRVLKETDVGIPGDVDQWVLTNYRQRMNEFKDKIRAIIEKLKLHDGELFHRPVTEAIAPEYFVKIKAPMDFWTIERRLNRFPDYYKTPEMLYTDMHLLIENCKTYNQGNQDILPIANLTWSEFSKLYKSLAADGICDGPSRS